MINEAFAMAPPGTGGGDGGAMQLLVGIVPFIIIFGIFYFLLIRPQIQKQKKQDGMISSLKEGDNVLTRGGIYGVITKIKEDIVTLKISENVRVKAQKSSITALKGKEDS